MRNYTKFDSVLTIIHLIFIFALFYIFLYIFNYFNIKLMIIQNNKISVIVIENFYYSEYQNSEHIFVLKNDTCEKINILFFIISETINISFNCIYYLKNI